jgi:hypothetical protein
MVHRFVQERLGRWSSETEERLPETCKAGPWCIKRRPKFRPSIEPAASHRQSFCMVARTRFVGDFLNLLRCHVAAGSSNVQRPRDDVGSLSLL